MTSCRLSNESLGGIARGLASHPVPRKLVPRIGRSPCTDTDVRGRRREATSGAEPHTAAGSGRPRRGASRANWRSRNKKALGSHGSQGGERIHFCPRAIGSLRRLASVRPTLAGVFSKYAAGQRLRRPCRIANPHGPHRNRLEPIPLSPLKLPRSRSTLNDDGAKNMPFDERGQ